MKTLLPCDSAITTLNLVLDSNVTRYTRNSFYPAYASRALQYVDCLGELPSAPGAVAEFAEDLTRDTIGGLMGAAR
jgi:hypothetical protein